MTTPGGAAMTAGAADSMALTEMSVTAYQSALNASSSGSLRISTLPGLLQGDEVAAGEAVRMIGPQVRVAAAYVPALLVGHEEPVTDIAAVGHVDRPDGAGPDHRATGSHLDPRGDGVDVPFDAHLFRGTPHSSQATLPSTASK